jgi:HlyD family secretion protein
MMAKPVTRIVGGVGLLAVLALVVVSFLPQPVPVDVAPVTQGRFEQTVDEDGKTRVRERYVVSAPLAGRVLRIQLKEGDAIDRGALLAVMVPAAPALLDVRTEQELRERLAAAEDESRRTKAVVQRAKAALKQARIDLDRSRELARERLVPPAQLELDELDVTLRRKDVEAAEFEDRVAGHQVEVARAALLQVRKGIDPGTAPDRLEIRSPVPGRVLRVVQESEAVVALGTPLLEIADPSDLEVVVDVLTTDAVQIKPGMTARIERYGAGEPLAGRVRLIEPSGFTKISALGVEEQRVNVVIDPVSQSEHWRALGDGYRVEARIIVHEEPDAVKVPAGAVFREGEQSTVFVLDGARARKRAVEIGHRNGIEATIATGLEVGDLVVVYPSDAVTDGVRVERRSGAG